MKDSKYEILLIEDDKLDQMAFTQAVEDGELPYDCIIAGSVSEARDILAGRQFDIVISDYSLGDGTALDILALVTDIPVILVTGAGDEEVAVSAYKAGAYDYLTKDFERSYLKTLPITVENAIRHHETERQMHLLSAAVMSTSESVYITNLEDRIIFVNKAFCKTYGYQQDEVIAKNSHVLWMGKPQNNYTRSVFRTSFGGGECEIGFYHRRKDGSIFPVSISRSIVKDAKGNSIAVVGMVRDITELVRIEDKMKVLNEKLQQQTGVTV